jgi:hypothetical protein
MHVLHAVATLVTVGLWAIVWAFRAMWLAGKPYRCQTCGQELVRIEEAGGVVRWEAFGAEGEPG